MRLPEVGRLVAALVVTVTAGAACSQQPPGEVTIVDGTLPPEATATSAPDRTTTTAATLGPPTLDAASVVSTVGIDTLTFGMTIAEAESATGTRLVATPEEAGAGCDWLRPQEGLAGLRFLAVGDRVEGLAVDEATVETRSGAGVGDTVDEIIELFGDRIERSGDEGAETLTYVPEDEQDAAYRIIFETADGRVVAYRAGRLPHIETGCT